MGDSEAGGFIQKWRLYFRSEWLTWLGIPELNEGVNDKKTYVYISMYIYIYIYVCIINGELSIAMFDQKR